MQRRFLKAMACLMAVALLGAPVMADDFTGSERELRTLKCGGPYPSNQEPPAAGECTGDATTYKGYVYTNNVKCNGGETTNAQGVRVYHNNGGTNGGVGICNDGSGAVGSQVIQGRAVASGDATKGGTVYIDGDKDNAQHAALQGWARADGQFAPQAPTVRCGDDNGRKDATAPTSADAQNDCG